MQRKLILTSDGSHTVSVPEMNVTYHSIHGAIRESNHVFIQAGMQFVAATRGPDPLRIFEMGFGTGLNALLALIESKNTGQRIYYETIDLFPLSPAEARQLNYCEQIQRSDVQEAFEQLHGCEWGKEIAMTSGFTFKKSTADLLTWRAQSAFDLVYFDAFDPKAQPELWTKQVFEKMFAMLTPGGVLVTYSSKGDVRRAMTAAGFKVEKIPGPPGKREITRGKALHSGRNAP